jgi:hypothetical protein
MSATVRPRRDFLRRVAAIPLAAVAAATFIAHVAAADVDSGDWLYIGDLPEDAKFHIRGLVECLRKAEAGRAGRS